MLKTFYRLKKVRVFEKLKYVINIILASVIRAVNIEKSETDKEIWIIGAGNDIFANNTGIFYQYMITNHPEIVIYWVCNKTNRGTMAENVPEKQIVDRGSVKNYLLMYRAKVALCGFSDYDVSPGFFRIIKRHKCLLIDLGHGFDGLKGMPSNYYSKLPHDMFCAASEYEKRIKVEKCGADINKVVVTGFARYDNWPIDHKNDDKTVKKIFIMPTWRDWYESEDIEWYDSEMYQVYVKLLSKLNKVAETYRFKVVYSFHPRLQSYKISENPLPFYDNVCRLSDNASIKNELIDSDIIITDYSSIFWDAIYMGKKTILFWFDEQEYKVKRGLLADENFYLYIVRNTDEILSAICRMIDNPNNDAVETRYFDWHDQNNCSRIFEAIRKLKKGVR